MLNIMILGLVIVAGRQDLRVPRSVEHRMVRLTMSEEIVGINGMVGEREGSDRQTGRSSWMDKNCASKGFPQ